MSGSTDTKLVIAFDARIGNLETQLKKISKSLKDTNDRAKQTQTGITGLGASLSRAGSAATSAISALTRLVGVFGIGIGISAAVSGFMRLADAVGNLGEQSQQVGVSIEGLQAWQSIGLQFNVTAEGMATALTRLTRTIGEAAEGNEEAQAKFVRLGVSIRNAEGNVRPTEEVLADLSTAIAGLGSPAEQAAAAVQFFGRAGQSLLPILVEIGEKQTDVVTRARDMGAVISTEVSSSFDKFGDSLAEFGRRIYVFTANVLAPLADAIGNIFSAMNRSLALGAQAGRIRAGEGTSGDLERAEQIRDRQRQIEQQIAADLERRSSGSGRLTERELRPYRERLEAARALTQQYEGEVTRIQGLAQAERQRQAENAGRIQRETAARTLTDLQNQEEAARRRAAAARQGPEALRQFEVGQDAERRYRDAIKQLQDRGVDVDRLDPAVTQGIRDRARSIAELSAVRAASGGGGRGTNQTEQELRRSLSEAARLFERVQEGARTPLETFQSNLTGVTTAVGAVGQSFGRMSEETRRALAQAQEALQGVGYEEFARYAEQGAERAAKAMRENASATGATTESIQRDLLASVEAFGQALVESGRLTQQQLDEMMGRARAAINRGLGDGEGADFWSGLRSGLGLEPGKRDIGFGETVGLGVGRETLRAFDDLFDLLDQVAKKSITAGEAFRQFAASLAQSVLKIVAQAALLQAVKAIFSYFFPAGPAGGVTGGASTGASVGGRMAGGAVAGGYPYIVGERGPELFVPSGSGRIINSGMTGGVNFIVNNNAPGVTVMQEQVDERTVIAAVNVARTEIARDYQRSLRTGFGPYSETLTRTHQVRRRM